MMNSWLNRTSLYPMLSWRAWKITVARRWFISWETKSNCFNLKLYGIQVESTKAQLLGTTANLLLSKGNISLQTAGVLYVKFPRTEMGIGGWWCNMSKVPLHAEPRESHHNKLQRPRGRQPLGASNTPWLHATPWWVRLLPQHPSLPVARAWIMPHVHIICGRRKSLFSRDAMGQCNLHVFNMGENPC